MWFMGCRQCPHLSLNPQPRRDREKRAKVLRHGTSGRWGSPEKVLLVPQTFAKLLPVPDQPYKSIPFLRAAVSLVEETCDNTSGLVSTLLCQSLLEQALGVQSTRAGMARAGGSSVQSCDSGGQAEG